MAASDHLAAVNQVLEHARRSTFYRDRLPAAPLRTWEELRLLPFTTREDLRRCSPHGLVSVPREALSQYHESSSTTGLPISAWYSAEDLEEIRSHFSRWGVGFAPGARVLIRFPYALSTIGHMVHAAAAHAGACVIPADSRTTITPLPRVVELLRKLEVHILATLSLSAVMVAEAAEMAGFKARRDFPHLRAICCAGEPLTPHRRQLLQEIWGVPVYDNYGMTETGPLAMACRVGRLHPWEDHFHMEVLDERLEREAPAGEIGQLVVTSLTRRATPMVRYVTGDRVRRMEEPCPCGQNVELHVRGREADTLRVKGRQLDLWDLEAIVSRLPSRRFWRVHAEADGLCFVVEKETDDEAIDPGLLEELEREHVVPVRVELVAKGFLYDRREPISFGMSGKPVYIERNILTSGHDARGAQRRTRS